MLNTFQACPWKADCEPLPPWEPARPTPESQWDQAMQLLDKAKKTQEHRALVGLGPFRVF